MLRERYVDRLERAGWMGWWKLGGKKKNAPLTWCFGTVELLWGWYRKPVLFGAEEDGVPPWRERMTEQRDTVWLTVTQPVFPALSGVNMEGWTGGNGHEKSLEGRWSTVEGLQLRYSCYLTYILQLHWVKYCLHEHLKICSALAYKSIQPHCEFL